MNIPRELQIIYEEMTNSAQRQEVKSTQLNTWLMAIEMIIIQLGEEE